MYQKKDTLKTKTKNLTDGNLSLIKEVFIKPQSVISKNKISGMLVKTLKQINKRTKPIIIILSTLPLALNAYLPFNLGTISSFDSTAKFISLDLDGTNRFFETTSDKLGDALKQEGISFDEHDLVDPSPDSAITMGINGVVFKKAHPIRIYDGKKIIDTETPYFQVEEILSNLEINLYAEDKVTVSSPLEGVNIKSEIYIDRSPIVMLQVDGVTREIHTRAKDIRSLLENEKIVLATADKVMPDINTEITRDLDVAVIRVVQSEDAQIVDIPFAVEYKNDPGLLQGQSRIERKGITGKRIVKIAQTIENGSVAVQAILSETIISEPVPQIVIRGTKPKVTYASGAFSDWINDAAQKYGVDGAKLSRMMFCESGGNPNSVSRSGSFHGLFQYLPSTWSGASAQAGWGGSSIYDAQAQIYTTAWKISVQGYKAWPVCGLR